MTHGQTVVGEVGGDPQTPFDGVRVGLHTREQGVLGRFALGLRADVQVLSLEGCESPQAVGHLEKEGGEEAIKTFKKRVPYDGANPLR